MPPKRAKKDTPESEDDIDDVESDEEELLDPDYQEEHHEDKSAKSAKADLTKADKEESDDEKQAESDDENQDVDFDVMDLPDEEAGGDEVEPTHPELVKNRTVIPPGERQTTDRLQLFECARVLGDRARHIDNNARPNIDTKNCTSSLEIAYLELMQKRIPMAVIRKVGGGAVEIWRVKEMTLPKLPPIEYFMMK